MTTTTRQAIEDLALAVRVSCRRSGRSDSAAVAEEILDRGEARFASLVADLDAGRVAWSTITRTVNRKADR